MYACCVSRNSSLGNTIQSAEVARVECECCFESSQSMPISSDIYIYIWRRLIPLWLVGPQTERTSDGEGGWALLPPRPFEKQGTYVDLGSEKAA